uniref:Xylulose kinase-1 n=1 Tax=Tanacetum cinerariifolium TaxID=118510 RepID=A0A6L2MYM3_TANCI|nr:hypothetical protein [Tanacetum cinerariifolium]
MTLTFTDTHNMIAYLTKSEASEGFNQIIDFLNGSSIKYALTVNLNIYVSCIKQFWTSVAVNKVNDIMRLQALVNKKRVIITEAIIRDALHLDDAKGIECLPNEEIFTELARMGYEKPSTKLAFYKAFFSSQWKFLIHTILLCMSAKRISWNGFSSSIASAVICLSLGRNFNFSKAQVGDLFTHTTKYSSPALTQKVFANMRRVGKGFSGVETPLFEGMIVEQPVGDSANEVHDEGVPATGIAAEGDVSAANDEGRKAESQARIYQIDLKHADKVLSMQDDQVEPAELQEVVEVVTTTKLITEVVTDASATTTVVAPQLTTAAAPTLTITPSTGRRIKGVTDEEDSRALKRLSETQEEKAGKKQKLDEEVEELRRHLLIVPNDEDDVYTEATPLARKVPVVDYEIYIENNKPYYKIKRADGQVKTAEIQSDAADTS